MNYGYKIHVKISICISREIVLTNDNLMLTYKEDTTFFTLIIIYFYTLRRGIFIGHSLSAG